MPSQEILVFSSLQVYAFGATEPEHMTNIQTSETLLRALRESANRDISADVVREQRISFVMGAVKRSDNVTRTMVERVLNRQEGKVGGDSF